jgi:hypothetical protein
LPAKQRIFRTEDVLFVLRVKVWLLFNSILPDNYENTNHFYGSVNDSIFAAE